MSEQQDYRRAQACLKVIYDSLSNRGRKQCAEEIKYLRKFLSEEKKLQTGNSHNDDIRPIDEVVNELALEYDAAKMELNIDEYRGL